MDSLVESPIEIVVGREVHCRPEEAYQALLDWERFTDWWRVPVTIDQEKFFIRPLPFVQISMSLARAEPPSTIVYHYVGGPFRGEGVWQLNESKANDVLCHVEYTIRLHPVNFLIKLFASTWVFRVKHRHDINQILDRLCE